MRDFLTGMVYHATGNIKKVAVDEGRGSSSTISVGPISVTTILVGCVILVMDLVAVLLVS